MWRYESHHDEKCNFFIFQEFLRFTFAKFGSRDYEFVEFFVGKLIVVVVVVGKTLVSYNSQFLSFVVISIFNNFTVFHFYIPNDVECKDVEYLKTFEVVFLACWTCSYKLYF